MHNGNVEENRPRVQREEPMFALSLSMMKTKKMVCIELHSREMCFAMLSNKRSRFTIRQMNISK